MLASGYVRQRPIYYRELGDFFAALRPTDWTQSDAARFAKQRGLTPISRNVLLRLEKGQIKNPEPDVLKALATLYDMPYETLAGRFIEQRYGIRLGRDLPRHQSDQGSVPGGADVPATARILELEHRVTDYETALDSLQDVAKRLVEIAAVRQKGRATATRKTGRGRSHRRTG